MEREKNKAKDGEALYKLMNYTRKNNTKLYTEK